MSKTQQQETHTYFDDNAEKWREKASGVNTNSVNVVSQRNSYVLDVIRERKSTTYMLDVGCGTGDLVCDSSKYVDKSIGIDFSRKMIDIASKKIEEKKHNNCDFLYGSIFDISLTKNMFDLISANGFIEYISEDELIIFLGIVYKALSPSGSLVLGSRNRLFNIFSLNSFTTKEINSGYLDLLLAESIHWTSGKTIKEILGPKLAPTQCNNETHSKTGVNVSTRFQYTPFQLIDILSSCGFEAVEIYPIYVHGAPPSFKNNNLAVHTKISNILQDYARNNQELVPFSSSFMLHIKKK